ncbi:MAG: ferrous iron transport protein B [candidate division Zixibacteria bacterium]|nr:ferrous iron transport protein B [candidate division Zixibacteria bacterium]
MKEVAAKKRRFTVALAGNPNCGKTSVFNALTGAKAHVGNYPGVTVEKRSARVLADDLDIEYVDLPGVYSLSAITLDESAARNFILHEEPDLVINIIDAGNLERNLLLTTQLMEMGVRILLVLNMWDEAEKQGLLVNEEELSRRLRSPIVKTVGHRGIGMKQLRATVSKMLLTSQESHYSSPISYGAVIDREIETVAKSVAATSCNTLPPRWYAVNLLENSVVLEEFADLALVKKAGIMLQVAKSRQRIEQALDQRPEMAIGDGRHEYIRRTINAAIKQGSGDRMAFSNRIDNILTHRIFGYPIFLFFMWLIFQTTFVLGKYPANWIDRGITAFSGLVAAILPAGFLTDLLTQGVIGGVGSVLVFMPNIMILFLGIAVLEDSGYMARAAFIMDRLMRGLGLHGKAFIPMLMGFGCNVPAIMATPTRPYPDHFTHSLHVLFGTTVGLCVVRQRLLRRKRRQCDLCALPARRLGRGSSRLAIAQNLVYGSRYSFYHRISTLSPPYVPRRTVAYVGTRQGLFAQDGGRNSDRLGCALVYGCLPESGSVLARL